MLAEKFEAICALGSSTSRFKDFYDVRDMSRRLNFAGTDVVNAFKATFEKPGMPIPSSPPDSFNEAFREEGERDGVRSWPVSASVTTRTLPACWRRSSHSSCGSPRWHAEISPRPIGLLAPGGRMYLRSPDRWER